MQIAATTPKINHDARYTRRNMLKGAALTGLTAALPFAAAASADPHKAWVAEWIALDMQVQTCPDDIAGKTMIALSPRLNELERKICTTKATTPEGLAAQVEYMLKSWGDYVTGFMGDDLDKKMFSNVLAGLNGLEA